jgi:hypothetical protein
MTKYFIVFILSIFNLICCVAQEKYNVIVDGLDAADEKKLGLNKITTYDSLQIKKAYTTLVNDFRINGYLFANADKIEYAAGRCQLYFNKGDRYQLRFLEENAEVKYLFELAGLSTSMQKLDSANINFRINKLLTYLNNNGYPFANISFNSSRIEANKLYASLQVNKGLLVTMDSISLPSGFDLNKNYLYKYLGIEKGKPYDHSMILGAGKKLKELPFVQADTLPTVSFLNDKAIIHLPIKNQGASTFDFILGFLPKVGTTERGWTINGEIAADLYNKLGQGEIITFKGRQYSPTDRQINFTLIYPYLLGTPFGFDGQFDLFQNRNISTDANGLIGLQYQYTGNNQLRLSWQSKTSRLSNLNTQSILNSGRLPLNLDYSYNAASVGMKYYNLDYKYNPTKGTSIDVSGNLGLRKIIENFQISELKSDKYDFSKAYDTLRTAKFQASINLLINHYFRITSWSTLRLGNNTGWRVTEGLLLENEVFRIGGNRLMRGFDELSILTDKYTTFTAEYRIVLEKNSYINLPFVEYSKVNLRKEGSTSWETGLAIGAGLNFSTQAGIFNFVLAAGNNLKGSPDFGQAKVHFGYINLF